MKRSLLLVLGPGLLLLLISPCFGQLQVTPNNNATLLAQKIAGEGVTISNATISGGANSRGFFVNSGGLTRIGIDSGVVLTSGRAKSNGFNLGIDGNGLTAAALVDADNGLNLPGDVNLASAIGVPLFNTKDACVLEFDFIPTGDTIKFNYVFSSEEYNPEFVCDFNDAFAFFISGPGITGLRNIALIPGTTTPVSILNVNNVQDIFDPFLCPNNIQYYVDNASNVYFTHDGHTTVFTAVSEVQPCQTYHLKMVIMDVGDSQFDSSVFLQAGSLRSDPLQIDSHNPLNDFNLPYLAEGCVPGGIHITRSRKKPYAQSLNILVTGSATNGVDVTSIPAIATIPANDSVVVIPISAISDNLAEGHETLRIFIANSCGSIFSDSIDIELRDVDLLAITPTDSARVCRNGSVQLQAATGYTNYSWSNATTLSANGISNPLATPGSGKTNYICTATIGNCIARDSVLLNWKTISLVSKTDVPCPNATTGAIAVSATGWTGTVSYAVNNAPFQSSNSFTGLRPGSYWVKVKDDTGCIDSIQVQLIQSFPDITLSANPTPATCSITPDGIIEVVAGGGSNPFVYSSNGTNFQPGNLLTVPEGSHTVYVKDGNGCVATLSPVVVGKINTVTVDAEDDTNICEGTSYRMTATANSGTVNWLPTSALTNTNTLTPTTSTTTSQKYYVTASFGTCTQIDSVTINVWSAPIPDAGDDTAICFGITTQLSGAGGLQFNWTPASTFVTPTDIKDPVVKPGVTSTYYLHVKDVNNCSSLQPDAVTVVVTPAVKIFAGRDTLVAINQPLRLNAIETNNSGVDKWEWISNVFLNDPFVASPIATFTSPSLIPPYEYSYTVTGTTPEGCQGSDEIKVKVYQGPEIYVPTAFTPNGDGKNELLIGLAVGFKEFKYIRVFNRWGQQVFYSQDPTRGWNGRVAGGEQPAGVYIWIAEGVDYTGKVITRKGMTTLIK
ncbi:MAG: choice-of-anchor L domain-containing protein [Chitinophagaceae bacterium]|nr:choice-of-anchor L domain-containing protein [Chitinophagaceae bacterium]